MKRHNNNLIINNQVILNLRTFVRMISEAHQHRAQQTAAVIGAGRQLEMKYSRAADAIERIDSQIEQAVASELSREEKNYRIQRETAGANLTALRGQLDHSRRIMEAETAEFQKSAATLERVKIEIDGICSDLNLAAVRSWSTMRKSATERPSSMSIPARAASVDFLLGLDAMDGEAGTNFDTSSPVMLSKAFSEQPPK